MLLLGLFLGFGTDFVLEAVELQARPTRSLRHRAAPGGKN
jgi:hypothetical protein